MVVVSDGGTTTQNADGTFTVTLTGVSPSVVGFVEGDGQTPSSVTSAEPLVAGWSILFQDGAPNAAMTGIDPELGTSEQVAVFEMGKPTYNKASNELTFSATVSEGQFDPTLTNVSLFIDPTALQWYSIANNCGITVLNITGAAVELGVNPLADLGAVAMSEACALAVNDAFGD